MLKRNYAYNKGDIEYSDGGVRLTCKTAGTTSTEDLVIPPNVSEVTDGTVIWSLIDISRGWGGEALTNYSLEEQRIGGTWIDGKPLYQITIQDTMPQCTEDAVRRIKSTNIHHLLIETPVSIAGICLFNGSSIALNSVLYLTHSGTKINYCQVEVGKSNTTYDWVSISNASTALNNYPVYITLQYTKV